MSAPAHPLLAQLREKGITVALNDSGDGLKLSSRQRPSAELLSEVRAAKSDLIEALRPPNIPPPVASRAPDWYALAQQAGHCGSCARFTPSPDWGPCLGECRAPTQAWWPDAPPLSIHMGHACPIKGTAGYQVKAQRQTDGR